VANVQDSVNIVKIVSDEEIWYDHWWSETQINTFSADYRKSYTPFVSKMENSVLTEGVTEISFAVDFDNDIENAKVSFVATLEDSNSNAATREVSHQANAKFNGHNVTVSVGWWHESSSWFKGFTDLAYGISVEDKAGTFHHYYFEVKYTTSDPAGLFEEEDYVAYLNYQDWYWEAMGCTFAAPEEISLEYYFYNGVGDKTQATGEELDFIVDTYKKKNPGYNGQYNYIRMPAEKLNEGLAILALTLEDVTIPDSWAYYNKLDTYYSWRTDAYGVVGTEITKVEIGKDGIVKAYWQTDNSLFNTSTKEFYPSGTKKMVMTLQEMPDGTLCVLSNLPQT